MIMTVDEYLENVENNNGICLACGNIQEGGVEPDAENYVCEECGEHRVYGIENAMLMNYITIEEEE